MAGAALVAGVGVELGEPVPKRLQDEKIVNANTRLDRSRRKRGRVDFLALFIKMKVSFALAGVSFFAWYRSLSLSF
jgi:hypothetical protein